MKGEADEILSGLEMKSFQAVRDVAHSLPANSLSSV
jgi:hypothetical protein